MAKIIMTLLLYTSLSHAQQTFQNSCVACHETINLSLEKLYFRYVVRYSSANRIEEAMTNYLLDPKANLSVLTPNALTRWGVKKAYEGNQESLRALLKVYIAQYEVKGRLQ